MFQVGYSRVDITPTESVPLAGYGNSPFRMSNNVLDPLCSACTALTDENGTTVLLFHNDLISGTNHLSIPCRTAVSEATGIPFENIAFCVTHCHSAPDVWCKEMPSIVRYLEYLPQLLVTCAQQALEDRKPATAFSAKVHTDRLNFVRHYILEDGHYKGDNFGTQHSSPIAGHTTQADPEMRLVKFVRQGGKDVVLANWQVHPLCTAGSAALDLSADLVGAFRQQMEQALDCHFAYFNGGGGNLSHYSKIKDEAFARSKEEFGIALKNHALTAVYEPLALAPIQVAFRLYREPLNRPDAQQLAAAQKVSDYWKSTNDWAGSVEMAVQHGFSSQFAATSAITRHNEKSDTVDIPLTVISFGDFCFVTVPHEMFDTNAKYVRDNAPYPITFISSLSNGALPYIPSAYGFIHGCYEEATSKCKPGAGERVAQTLVTMLRSLK